MDNRREFLKKASILAGGAGMINSLPASIQRALAINPALGSTFFDAEHIVLLMQENRSFDHTYGSLQGVRGFNDPRAITLPNKNPVWLQSNKEGETYAPFRLNIKDTRATWMSSLPHSWSNQVDARNNGKYDGWLESKHSGHKEYAPMPLTMGYYTREDIPFYYSLADAFTVCDQNFCSSLTGTTPNRLYFWTGTIREKPDEQAMARVWNEDADYDTMVTWTTFPERLEDAGVSWKVYQNELSVGVGFQGEEDSWLSSFGDNPLEYFTQYHVKLSAGYIANLSKTAALLTGELEKMKQGAMGLTTGTELDRLTKRMQQYEQALAQNAEDQKNYTRERYDRLSQREKNLHDKAFSTNKGDPDYHSLTTLKYKDGDTEREVEVPKGDVLHQFRQDVNNGSLPAVSWIVAPENFSDHPGAAWYGAWYISEVMDILTKNPEVWKKTIFILTYDENDGYFDHVPPFVAPHKEGSGLTSAGIDTSLEYVKLPNQSIASQARESSIGLGYRVPLVIASPWSRGGWVCSEVFDHTSSLKFLETFLSKKLNKKIEESNITAWRRTVCGDLTSAFRTYNGERIKNPEFLQRDEFVESIHKAKFKKLPSDFIKLSAEQIEQVKKHPVHSPLLAQQEKGSRSSCALPYELYADCELSADLKTVSVQLRAGNTVFGTQSAGSAFHIYAPGAFRQEIMRSWDYAVAAGNEISDLWTISDFDNNQYHLQVYGPNGFFREFKGNNKDPKLMIRCNYEYNKTKPKKFTGNVSLSFVNHSTQAQVIEITDNAYKTPALHKTIPAVTAGGKAVFVVLNLSKSFGWYDFTVRVKGAASFEKRYAGRVETGQPTKTDPYMGRMV